MGKTVYSPQFGQAHWQMPARVPLSRGTTLWWQPHFQGQGTKSRGLPCLARRKRAVKVSRSDLRWCFQMMYGAVPPGTDSRADQKAVESGVLIAGRAGEKEAEAEAEAGDEESGWCPSVILLFG